MLHNFDPSNFLSQYWQKAPCLIKSAFTRPLRYVTPEELAGLAMEEDVESRIIQNIKGDWRLLHGPFEEDQFQQLPENDWTLLVQTADYWIPELNQMLQNFRFIPRWRFDDVMISYATEGGGVGPHFDNYDVFIIQTEGERRWRVGNKGDTKATQTVINDLLHLDKFEPVIDVILQPGDMLYIPLDTPHWGISLNNSMSYSVGYRAPQTRDVLSILAEHFVDSCENQFFSDEYRCKPNSSAKIEPELIEWAQNEIKKIAKNQTLITELLSNFLSRPKLEDVQPNEFKNDVRLSDLSQVQLRDHVNFNWYADKNKVVLSVESESFEFPLQYQSAVEALAKGEAIILSKQNNNAVEFTFYQTLARLLERDYFLYS